MFLGEFRHSLDTKGRLVLPAKYRTSVEEGVVLTKSQTGRYLLGFTRPDWDDLAVRLAEVRAKDPRRRQAERTWFSSAHDLEVDKAGRILVPPPLRDYAGLESDVVILGVNDRFEVWDASSFDSAQTQDAEPDADLHHDVPELAY